MATIEEHAAAIQAALDAAWSDGFELDNGVGEPLHRVELNNFKGNETLRCIKIEVPTSG